MVSPDAGAAKRASLHTNKDVSKKKTCNLFFI
jgi:hypothetical protein